MQEPTQASNINERYQLGNHVLGPALVHFSRALLSAAKRDGITRLAFVARDGEFLMQVTEQIGHHLNWPMPEFDYVYLSRISTSLAAQADFGVDSLRGASQVRAGATTVEAVFAFFGLDVSDMTTALERYDLTVGMLVTDYVKLALFLDDMVVKNWIIEQRNIQRKSLLAYLEQHQILGNPQCALVDIGWHGSILNWLACAFPDACAQAPIRAYYFGYWHDNNMPPIPSVNIIGLITDYRRRRTVVEAASRYLACLFESVCRADHGTVTGYRMDENAQVMPVLTPNGTHNAIEQAANAWREPIRRGILECIPKAIHDGTIDDKDELVIHRSIQRNLFRLAFFPTKSELIAVSNLVHTEGHRSQWSRPLVDKMLPNPLMSPRQWLRGMSSPWRSAYVAASGGVVVSVLFILVESLLLLVPPATRQRVERYARRLGKLP